MSYKILLVIFFIMRLFYCPIIFYITANIYLSTAYATPLANLKTGLAAIKAQDIVKAIIIQNTLPKNSIEAKLMLWAMATSELKNTPSQLIKLALQELKTWPAQNKMKANFEKALYAELSQHNSTMSLKINNAQASDILKFFQEKTPLTPEGMALLVASATYKHQPQVAYSKLANYWYTTPFCTPIQKLILANGGKLLSSIDHLKRLRMLLLTRHFEEAKQLAPLAYAAPITSAFIAVAKNNKNSLEILKKIPKKWQTGTLYQYAYIEYLRHNHSYQLAAERLNHLPQTNAFLVYPTIWWHLRMALSWELLDAGKPKLAYELINKPSIKNTYQAAEQELRAGWLCLRFLNNPTKAIAHFLHVLNYEKDKKHAAKTYYWLGRCYQKLGKPKLAQAYYQNSAKFNTNYYGQLSAAALGQTKLALTMPKDTANIKLPSFQAQILNKLNKITAIDHSRIWAISLANNLNSREEIIILIKKMCEYKDYYAALKIAKIAAARNMDIGILTHITGAIPSELKLKPQDKALAYAIARQESEFNPKAVSSAGALGIMQLVPQTAKEIARKTGQKFSLEKLTSSASYNIKLGLNFLQQQINNFNGSYLLTFAAYNAGPHRTAQWVARYGDPRKMNLYQEIDWVERIPYSETRNYVMRVLENYEIYKTKLIGRMDIVSDLKGRPAH
ncbi:lytic transglycosylase domain-containing protein [Bartonella sp. TP]|uniref:lytic transglycosylase domain-containing protein n=1 Tax=Bartonella sp. TP TaxID=3057550 RepID=UPI0025B168EF|nr:lytic transglycosylase domain-containing protein [Bartonella sp. TP]WJW80151.1 lytic transglycosylase domain-containing protein [Bartonella sp. TP]